MALYRIPGFALNALPRVNMRIDRLYRREIQNILEYYNDEECRARYRFGKNTIAFIVNLVHDEISPLTKRSFSISATEQVLITGSFLPQEASFKSPVTLSLPCINPLSVEWYAESA